MNQLSSVPFPCVIQRRSETDAQKLTTSSIKRQKINDKYRKKDENK